MQKSPMLLTQFWLEIGLHTVTKDDFVSLANRIQSITKVNVLDIKGH